MINFIQISNTFSGLNGITIDLPPLREREDDVLFIANHLVKKFSKEVGNEVKKLTAESNKAIKEYRWPGNIRELENKIKRALVLSTDRYIKPADLGIGHKHSVYQGFTLKEAKEKVEEEMLLHRLEKYNGNLSKVSKSLGVSRSTISELLIRRILI